MKGVGVMVQRNIWKGGRWENPAWEELATGSFSGVECVGECQQKIFAWSLKREDDHRNIKLLVSVLVIHQEIFWFGGLFCPDLPLPNTGIFGKSM